MQRRNFLRLSATSAAAVAVAPSLITQKLYAEDGSLFKAYEKVQLKDSEGNPLKSASLVEEENYVFNYPHAGYEVKSCGWNRVCLQRWCWF